VGFATASLAPVVITLLEESTPEGLRGRVLTTFNATSMAMAMIGMLGFGWAADHVGVDPTLIAVGVVLVFAATVLVVVSRTSSARRLMGRSHTPDEGGASRPYRQ
jgi:MFS family permease